MRSQQNKKKIKQPYQKPRLRTIELAADEVLAVGCKITGMSPGVGLPFNCGIDTPCNQHGS